MSSVRVQINERYIKKDGTAAVYAVVSCSDRSIRINTGVLVAPIKFDKIKGQVKGSSKQVKDENLIIDNCLSRITKIQIQYRLQYMELTASRFFKEYRNPSLYIDFYKYMDEMLIERVKAREISETSERHQRVTLNKLKEYKSTLVFAEIDHRFIEDFRKWLRVEKGNSVNTIDKTLGCFKAYLNIAQRDQIISSNPFDLIVRRREKTKRYYLTEDEFRDIIGVYDDQQLPEDLHRTLRHFLFMCLTGVRISDFMRLCKSNVHDGVLRFIPYKTRAQKQLEAHVPLIEKANELIADENSQLPQLFLSFKEQKFNGQLKEIMNIVGIKKPITSHSARHTFAHMFLEFTNDVVTLQKILGHSNIEDTMVYVHISNKKIDEQMRNFNSLLEFD